MRPIAYIQKVKGEFSNINFLTAYIGLTRFQGYQARFFESFEEIENLITRETVVYGGIPIMDKVFRKLEVNPSVEYYPSELTPWLGRSVFKATVAEVYEMVENGRTLFVKPAYAQKKSFAGHLMVKFVDLIRMNHLPGETTVVCSEPVKFVSEYRFFMHKQHGALCAKHYAGDWKKVVDFDVADKCWKAWPNSPVAYSLDLGLTDDGRTLLVECNDALSLGCYGLDPSFFSIMIVDRWNEIMKS